MRAARVLAAYRFGLLRQNVQVEHGMNRSTAGILIELVRSEHYARALKAVEKSRRRLTAAVTVQPEEEKPS